LEEIIKVIHEYGAIAIVDAVTSLAGVPLHVDKWDLDKENITLLLAALKNLLKCYRKEKEPAVLTPVLFLIQDNSSERFVIMDGFHEAFFYLAKAAFLSVFTWAFVTSATCAGWTTSTE